MEKFSWLNMSERKERSANSVIVGALGTLDTLNFMIGCSDDPSVLTKDLEEAMTELTDELTWMRCFLVTAERTEHGKAAADVWSAAIKLLAERVEKLSDGGATRTINLTTQDFVVLWKKFASLRRKIQPFVATCLCRAPSSSSSSSSV
ncbi:unnamed protein product [Cuscuta epithymum]|uniref:Disease resistance N-terminal domain-containing protein n=1 Tax=Cuscuta epithymum TaxID=186058 RepID=A0AAV0D841_9ASTE|nr:unnamed protein product [Cuscuta epithymum]